MFLVANSMFPSQLMLFMYYPNPVQIQCSLIHGITYLCLRPLAVTLIALDYFKVFHFWYIFLIDMNIISP